MIAYLINISKITLFNKNYSNYKKHDLNHVFYSIFFKKLFLCIFIAP